MNIDLLSLLVNSVGTVAAIFWKAAEAQPWPFIALGLLAVIGWLVPNRRRRRS